MSRILTINPFYIIYKSNIIKTILKLMLLTLSFNLLAQGQTVITDTNASIATNDGTINGGEYPGASVSCGNGFGGMLGSASISIDSDTGGNLVLGISGGTALTPTNAIVIYIDVDGTDGGVANTNSINDNSDNGRAAISGNGVNSGTSELTFASGFQADYAIVIEDGSRSLFQLNATSLNFINNPTENTNGTSREFSGFSLSNLGINPGASFNYVATLLNYDNAFRSNEFNGVASCPGVNIGTNPHSFAAGDFNTFHSFDPSPNIVNIVDNSENIATNDGTVNSGEYAGFSTGCGDGFAGILGGATLHFDSDAAGNLAMALEGGSSFGATDAIVVYIDVNGTTGGVTSTSSLSDTGDAGRAAVSGNGTGGGASDLTFPTDFNPDFAIVIDDGAGAQNLFELNPTNNLTFVVTLTQNTSGANREFSGFTLADLGLSSGNSFNYIATLINHDNAFRSDEFHGVSYCPIGNIGANAYSLSAGEFNTFKSVVNIPTLSEWGLLILALLLMTFGTLYITQMKPKRA